MRNDSILVFSICSRVMPHSHVSQEEGERIIIPFLHFHTHGVLSIQSPCAHDVMQVAVFGPVDVIACLVWPGRCKVDRFWVI